VIPERPEEADVTAIERVQDGPGPQGGGVAVPLPAPGEVVSLPVLPGQTVRLGFDAGPGEVMIFGDDLVLDFGAGRVLRLEDFVDAARAAPPAVLELADGRFLPGDALLRALAEAASPAWAAPEPGASLGAERSALQPS